MQKKDFVLNIFLTLVMVIFLFLKGRYIDDHAVIVFVAFVVVLLLIWGPQIYKMIKK